MREQIIFLVILLSFYKGEWIFKTFRYLIFKIKINHIADLLDHENCNILKYAENKGRSGSTASNLQIVNFHSCSMNPGQVTICGAN